MILVCWGEIQGGGVVHVGAVFKGVGKHFFWNRGQNTVQGSSLATIFILKGIFSNSGSIRKIRVSLYSQKNNSFFYFLF